MHFSLLVLLYNGTEKLPHNNRPNMRVKQIVEKVQVLPIVPFVGLGGEEFGPSLLFSANWKNGCLLMSGRTRKTNTSLVACINTSLPKDLGTLNGSLV